MKSKRSKTVQVVHLGNYWEIWWVIGFFKLASMNRVVSSPPWRAVFECVFVSMINILVFLSFLFSGQNKLDISQWLLCVRLWDNRKTCPDWMNKLINTWWRAAFQLSARLLTCMFFPVQVVYCVCLVVLVCRGAVWFEHIQLVSAAWNGSKW